MSQSKATAQVQITGYDYGTPLRVEGRSVTASHQVAIFDFSTTMKVQPPAGTPVAAVWGYPPMGLKRFYGYVHHVEELSGGAHLTYRVFSIGCSSPMNNETPRVWTNVTGSSIAAEVAGRYGFRCVLNKSNTVLPFWSQTNESDFAMLTRLADQIGYDFWFDGTSMYFMDPSRLLSGTSSQPITLTKNENTDLSNTLTGFHVIDGPDVNSNTINEVHGVDQFGQPIKMTSAKAMTDLGLALPTRTVVSGTSATSLAAAADQINSSIATGIWSTMEATTANIRPLMIGQTVNVQGRSVAPKHRGIWLVTSSVDVVENTKSGWDLTSTLTLTRNSAGSQISASLNVTNSPLASGSSALRNGKWTSSTLETRYV